MTAAARASMLAGVVAVAAIFAACGSDYGAAGPTSGAVVRSTSTAQPPTAVQRPVSTPDSPTGAITGKINIGPLCPVEPCPGTPPNPFAGLQIVLKFGDAEVARFDVQDDGTFAADVAGGTYELFVEPCEFLGCRFTLPQKVVVLPGATAQVLVEIDTGIR